MVIQIKHGHLRFLPHLVSPRKKEGKRDAGKKEQNNRITLQTENLYYLNTSAVSKNGTPAKEFPAGSSKLVGIFKYI